MIEINFNLCWKKKVWSGTKSTRIYDAKRFVGEGIDNDNEEIRVGPILHTTRYWHVEF